MEQVKVSRPAGQRAPQGSKVLGPSRPFGEVGSPGAATAARTPAGGGGPAWDLLRLVGRPAAAAPAAGPAGRPAAPVVQRMKADAEAYNSTNGLGLGAVTKASVIAYVQDTTKPFAHRQGLYNAWNLNQVPAHRITAVVTPSAAPAVLPGGGGGGVGPEHFFYDSDESTEMDEDEYTDMRWEASQEARTELKTSGIEVPHFRDKTTRYESTSTSYGSTSSRVSNLVSGKGFNTGQSEYPNVIKTLRGVTGSDRKTSKLMLKGLYDAPGFATKLGKIGDPQDKNKVQFFLHLLINEILGRSTSNLPEITAMLQNTVRKDDAKLDKRFAKYGMFVPKGADHPGKIGGQQLSRWGWEDLDASDLDSALTAVLANNRKLYHSLQAKLGAKDADELKQKIGHLEKQFISNITSHYKVSHS